LNGEKGTVKPETGISTTTGKTGELT